MNKKIVGAVTVVALIGGLAGCSAESAEDKFFDYWLENTSRGVANEYANARDKDGYKAMVIAGGYDICDTVETMGFSISYLLAFMKADKASVGAMSIPDAAGKFLCPELW